MVDQTVVYILDGDEDVSETENILKQSGIKNFKCYLDGMENWIKFGGMIEFPRFINFKVRFQKYWTALVLLSNTVAFQDRNF